MMRYSTLIKISEALLFIFLCAIFFHLSTSGKAAFWNVVLSFAIVFAMGILCFASLIRGMDSRRSLLAPLAGMTIGFWVFNMFRFFGYVRWPLAHAACMNDYLLLLYFHFVLSFTVLTPVLIITHLTKCQTLVKWGSWQVGPFSSMSKIAFIISACGKNRGQPLTCDKFMCISQP